MLFFALMLVAMMVYSVPGLYLARGMYASAVREINSRPVIVVPPQPERPKIKVVEMLHATMPKRCNALQGVSHTCDCRHREDWIELRNNWINYNEWNRDYGHIKNGVDREPTVDMRPIYTAVPLWPLVAGAMFIKGGAKNIPDYRAIERIENELRELS